VVRRAYPVRTCVGCRKRAPASELLRVIAVSRNLSDARNHDGVVIFDIVPDPARRFPGRGAHVHADSDCLAQAVRRRAFGRALRVAGVTETGALAEFIADSGSVADA
jgi:predicted RNA-binding protein YlxR (DUF448 family)